MSAILLETAVILLLLTVNGVLAMSELAVVTARRFRLERRAARGDARARTAAELAANPTRFLSTVQIGITLVGILAGAFGGATIAGVLDDALERVPALAPYSEALGLGIVVLAITYCSLVIGELVPKRIALNNPDGIAVRVARPMRVLSRVASPLVRLLSASTNLVLRVLRVRDAGKPRVTEEEIRALIAQGAQSGAVLRAEQDILERALLLGNREVAAVMTPRPDMDWIDVALPSQEVRDAILASLHSRLLVCDGEIDRVIGVVSAKALLARCLRGEPLELRSELREPLFVPETMPVMRLLENLRRSDAKVAVILDEFGSVEGIVTLNDLLEELVADVPGVSPSADDEIVEREGGGWLVDGAVPVEELAEELGIDLRELPERPGYRTIGGLVMERLGHVPTVGESFTWAGHRVEVLDMDGRRIDRVLVNTPAPESEMTAGDAERRSQARDDGPRNGS